MVAIGSATGFSGGAAVNFLADLDGSLFFWHQGLDLFQKVWQIAGENPPHFFQVDCIIGMNQVIAHPRY
jgi:hypothetical protein